jgi:hypothetical protein
MMFDAEAAELELEPHHVRDGPPVVLLASGAPTYLPMLEF